MLNQSDIPNSKTVIILDNKLDKGPSANRAAVIATGLAAHVPNMIGSDIITKDNKKILGFTQIPIPILVTRDDVPLLDLAQKSGEKGCITIIFLSRAQGMRSYREYIDTIKQTEYKDLDIDALGISGDTKQVTKLTGNLPSLK